MAARARAHPASRPVDRRPDQVPRRRPVNTFTDRNHQGAALQHDSAPVLRARGLSKAYKNKLALDGTTFQIHSGRIGGRIGPNGAGKTTALKAILGLIPVEGELNVL